MNDDTAILPTSDGHHDREDMRLLRRAIREGWNIDPAWKKTLPARMARIVADPNSKNRDAIAAQAVLVTMNQKNIDNIVELVRLSNPQQQPGGTTVNVNATVNIDALARIAADPDAYAEFVRLANAVNKPTPEPPSNGNRNGTH